MIFQTGYTWGGGQDYLCPPENEWHDWTEDLLKKAGWKVEASSCVVKDSKTGYRYYTNWTYQSNDRISNKRSYMASIAVKF